MQRLSIPPINYKFHAGALLLLATAGLWSFTASGKAISQWNEGKALSQAQSRAVGAIRSEAELTQAQIDNHVNIFDSVTVTGYVCDPNTPPDFDPSLFAKSERVNVADSYQRVVGVIHPGGRFEFHPGNCTGPFLN